MRVRITSLSRSRETRRDGPTWPGAHGAAAAVLVVVCLTLGCGDSAVIAPTADAPGAVAAPVITDIQASSIAVSEATVAWVTDRPALGHVEYGTTASYGSSAGVATAPDTAHQALLTGLAAATTYYYRVTARDVTNRASASADGTFTTEPESESEPPINGSGIWISPEELAWVPTTGTAWSNVLSEANGFCGAVDLSDQQQMTNVCIMAKALVFARTGDAAYRIDVIAALTQIVTALVYDGRALALGRELGAYVIAADLIELKSYDATLDGLFRTALRTLRTTYTSGAASSLIECHEKRPNNWGAHCGATRAAIAVYLDDTADLARTAQVFKGYLGDRSSYAGFEYGDDLSWQCDPNRPVGINPVGCARDGLSLDGVLPDDQRRGGSFTTSPPKENYVWEALQGLLAQAVILNRAGYPVWDWEDRALLRAVRWLHDEADYPAEGDDTWQPHIINYYYGTRFPAPTPARAGKNVGWTDWTHR